MKNFILLNLCLCLSWLSVAQPANDNPCGAIPVPISESSDPCTPQPYDVKGATYLNLAVPNICNNNKADAWYTFIPDRSTIYITTAGTVEMQVYTAPTCDGIFTQFNNCFTNTTLVFQFTPGTKYYLRVSNTANAADFLFSLCLSTRHPGKNQLVGINTNQPTANLDVRGNAYFKDSVYFQGTTSIRNVEVNSLRIKTGLLGNNNVLTSDASGVASWQNISSIPGQSWRFSGNDIYTTSGNVAIGTVNTTDKLEVVGKVCISGNLGVGSRGSFFPLQFGSQIGDKICLFGGASATSPHFGFGVSNMGLLQVHTSTTDDDIAFGYGNSSDFTERMRIKGNGNVGIGTSTPTSKLSVSSDGNELLGSSTSRTFKINAGSLSPKGNYNMGIASMGFKSNGNNASLGIRAYRFDAAEPGWLGTSILMQYDVDNTIQAAGNTAYFTICSNGNFGIGTVAPTEKFEVIGNINTQGQVKANGITLLSDSRYKQSITTLPNALNNVLKLRGTNYFYNTTVFPQMNFSSDKQMGLIAQEVEKVFPELVVTNGDGYKSVNYIGLIPVLIESIKTLQQQIDEIKNNKNSKNRE